MARTLFPHQVSAIQWMMDREKDIEAPGGFLCDEMGLGKTITSIGLLIKSRLPYTLILGPLAVLQQWVEAVREEGPAVFVIEKHHWICKGGNILKGRVYITNYDKLVSQPSAFTRKWDRILCDEAHTLRNCKGKRFKELKKLTTAHMWLLTGTPIVNSKKEFGSLLSLIKSSIGVDYSPSLQEAKQGMTKYALCRTTEQLRSVLPGIFPSKPTIVEHRLPFTTQEEELFYNTIQGKTKKQLEALMDSKDPDMIIMLQLLLRLRQISVHPQIYINSRRKRQPTYEQEDWKGSSTKLDGILNILRNDTQSHGYVIFCHFQEEMALLKAQLEQESCVGSVETYSGGLSSQQRVDVISATVHAVRRVDHVAAELRSTFPTIPSFSSTICSTIANFLPPKHTVLLAQIQTAGTGLNLQHMSRVIFTTPWWTAALMDQAIGRVLRMGQTEQVVIHHVAFEEEYDEEDEEYPMINIDDYINERVRFKRALCKDLLDAANHTV
jgi:SNF2 family DNA or RNA helicase